MIEPIREPRAICPGGPSALGVSARGGTEAWHPSGEEGAGAAKSQSRDGAETWTGWDEMGRRFCVGAAYRPALGQVRGPRLSRARALLPRDARQFSVLGFPDT